MIMTWFGVNCELDLSKRKLNVKDKRPFARPSGNRIFIGCSVADFRFSQQSHSQKERVTIESRVETMMSDDITLLSAPSLLESR